MPDDHRHPPKQKLLVDQGVEGRLQDSAGRLLKMKPGGDGINEG